MANCVNYNCTELGYHTPNDCNVQVQGGISAMIVFSCDFTTTDFSDATQVQADLTAGRARKISDIKVGINAAAEIESDAYVAGSTPRVTSYNRSGTLLDGNISDANIEFYNDLFKGQAFGAVLLYEVDADQVTAINPVGGVRFKGSRVIPNDTGEAQRFEGTFTWKSLTEGNIFSAPVGIF